MIKQPKISIIIPVYNTEKYITECIESILSQTYKEYEVIFVNDGSTDCSLEILKKYCIQYSDNFYVYSQSNQGQAAARNFGLKKAVGKYIAYIDADDRIIPNYLEVLYKAAESNNSELVICSYEKFDNSGKIILRRNAKDWEVYFGKNLTHTFQYSPWGKLIDRKMLVENHIEFCVGEKMEDGPYGIITNSVARNIVVLDFFGYQYRFYSESTMGEIRKQGISTSKLERQFPLKGIEYATKTVKRIRESREYDRILEFCVLKALGGFLFIFCKKDDKETLKDICKFTDYMIRTYFPNAVKNPYIKKRIKKLPFLHWMAVKVLVVTNQFGLLYSFVRVYRILFG